jgi:hypothetical protein
MRRILLNAGDLDCHLDLDCDFDCYVVAVLAPSLLWIVCGAYVPHTHDQGRLQNQLRYSLMLMTQL